MKLRFTLLQLLVILILSACEESSNKSNSLKFTKEDLPKAIPLTGHKYSFPQILNPRGIMVTNSKAIVFERKNVDNNKFHIIDLKTESYLQ